jgi:hypothetical protein
VTGSGLDDVMAELASARGPIQQAWHLVDEARTYAAGAQRALEDAEAETTRARMAPEAPLGAGYLSRAGVQLDVLRQRCTLTANVAGRIEELLDAAQSHVRLAKERLGAREQASDLAPADAAAASGLHASVDALTELLDLTTRLAQSTRRHLERAAETATLTMTPSLAPDVRDVAITSVDRGVQSAGRSVARADEAARHLQRGVEYTDTSTARSQAHADALAHTNPHGGSTACTRPERPSSPSR